ncbi:MAG: ABC transporter permease [Acidimicrobiales bacterium]
MNPVYRPSRWLNVLTHVVQRIVVLAVAIGVWQLLVSSATVSPQFLASPSQIVAALASGFRSGTLMSDLLVSLLRVGVGWSIGCALGYVIGLVVGANQLVDKLFTPVLELVRPVSPVALIPVAILWLGIGNRSKYAIIAFACFWPVLLNTIAGVKRIPELQKRVAKVLDLNRRDQVLKVLLPGSLPDVFVGLRLAAGIAFVVVVAAEFIGASNGLGYEILFAEQSFKTPLMYGAIVLLAILGLLANTVVVFISRLLIRWTY